MPLKKHTGKRLYSRSPCCPSILKVPFHH